MNENPLNEVVTDLKRRVQHLTDTNLQLVKQVDALLIERETLSLMHAARINEFDSLKKQHDTLKAKFDLHFPPFKPCIHGSHPERCEPCATGVE